MPQVVEHSILQPHAALIKEMQNYKIAHVYQNERDFLSLCFIFFNLFLHLPANAAT
jgi:hypothetical protein